MAPPEKWYFYGQEGGCTAEQIIVKLREVEIMETSEVGQGAPAVQTALVRMATLSLLITE
jgi:hypothetical protein